MKNIVIIVFLLISIADADFIRDEKEIVADSETCLMWQDNNVSKTVKKEWSEAMGYCEELTLGGYDDWRLPNINELISIVDYSKFNPAIKSSFKNVSSGDYWSSTTYSYYTYYAWIVSFGNGYQDSDNKVDRNYIRCVRAEQ